MRFRSRKGACSQLRSTKSTLNFSKVDFRDVDIALSSEKRDVIPTCRVRNLGSAHVDTRRSGCPLRRTCAATGAHIVRTDAQQMQILSLRTEHKTDSPDHTISRPKTHYALHNSSSTKSTLNFMMLTFELSTLSSESEKWDVLRTCRVRNLGSAHVDARLSGCPLRRTCAAMPAHFVRTG